MQHPLLERLALFAGRHYRQVFVVCLLLLVVSIGLASQLEFDIDVLGLLPQNEPALVTFRDTLEEFGSLDYLLVVVRVPEGAILDPYEQFVGILGPRLAELDQLEQVDYRIGEMEELLATFFPHAFLFLDREGLEIIGRKASAAGLEERAKELKRLIATPQSVVLKRLIQLDPLGVAEAFLGRLDSSQSGLSLDLSSGYLLSRDRRMLLVLVKPAKPPQDVDFAKALVSTVEGVIAGATAEWREGQRAGQPDPGVDLVGRYVIALGDEAVIRQDFITNVLTSTLGVLLLFLLAFRRFGPLLYAIVPLAMGLILTFGFSAATFGKLSAATSGVAALLIGLGIDFVIVSYGRYVEERTKGGDLRHAVVKMTGSSGRAVVVGGVTSAATFYSFAVTDFTGLRQMGLLTGTGILFCMAAVLVLLPALLAWNEQRADRRIRARRLHLHGFGSGRVMKVAMAWPRTVLTIALVLTAVAIVSATDLRFDDSVQSMRPEGSSAVSVRDEVAHSFSSGFDHMMLVISGDELDDVLELANRAAAGAQKLVDEGVLTGYDSVASLIPPPRRQREVLDWLAAERNDDLDLERIRSRFPELLREQKVNPAAFEEGLDLFARAASVTEPIGVEEVRETEQGRRLLDRYLREVDGGWKSVLYLFPPPKVWRRQPPPGAVALADELGPQAVLTGANVLSSVLRARVLRDAAVAAALGFVLVGILLYLDYRRLSDTLLSLAPLTVGILWMLGAMAYLGLSMNFMNIFVTTMIIGIGVDYGVHVIHRHREIQRGGGGGLERGIVETGKAITLAAMSTMVGFGSLSLSHWPGLRSMGLVAILGALSTCLVALTVLPAYLSLMRHRANAAARKETADV